MKVFITIPAVGSVATHIVDPHNHTLVASLIRRAEAYFNLAAKDWELLTDGGLASTSRRYFEQRCELNQVNGETLLKPFGITYDYPGCFPCFKVNGTTLLTVRAAVLAAIGKDEKWLA